MTDLFKIIKGQESAKRAAEIAAAGNHSILFHGPSGCGKTMLGSAITKVMESQQIDDLDLWRYENTERKLRQLMAGVIPLIATVSTLSTLPLAIIDRFDIVIRLNAVTAADLILPPPVEGLAEVKQRVDATRARTRPEHLTTNAVRLLREWAEKTNATARAYESAVNVARTIATMDCRDTIERVQIAEAASYRSVSK